MRGWATTLALAMACGTTQAVVLRTKAASFELDAKGSLAAIRRSGDARNLLAADQPAPLLQLRLGGQWHAPSSAAWDAVAGLLTLRYDDGVSARLRLAAKPTHLTLELVEVSPIGAADLVWWGPYPLVLGEYVGEVVGVSRDGKSAVGIQALNARTLGGAPAEENDIGVDGTEHDDPAHYPDLPAELNKASIFRGTVAWPTPFGSVLQAFCRDRSRDRVLSNWGWDKAAAPALSDGGIIGSRIALYAVASADALATIGAIELAEGLPHPQLEGQWAKTARGANASYLIVDFGEADIDQAIALTQRAGLRWLYHSSPFATWGHFQLKPNLFAHGRDGLRACAEKAKAAGIGLGFHTLSNFITPNDAYVSPKPDPRLARVGAARLVGPLDERATELVVDAPDYFRRKSALNALVIGDELVRFAEVSAEPPWRLTGCQRGAFGTVAAAHAAGAEAARLMDHDYKVFLTKADLSAEVARQIAELCNQTGMRQVSLDGLEGNWSTGHGQYGRALFTQAWYDALSPELRGQVRNDASNPCHWTWHMATYYNWGEPWYAGFRESQTLYRFKNQLFYTRNLLPRMLGWFSLRPQTTLADAEWLLARAAGYDAGFALAMSHDSLAQQAAASSGAGQVGGSVGAILDAVREWETARLAGAFSPEQRAQLRDNAREFHLERVGDGQWDLSTVVDGQRRSATRVRRR